MNRPPAQSWIAGWWRALGLAAVLLAISPRPASAQICTVTTLGVSFGTYDPLVTTPLDGLGSVTFECLLPLFGGNIMINLGAGSSTDINARTMTLLTRSLNYNLYVDAARTRVWGNGTTGENVTRAIPAGILTSGTVQVFARIPARQGVPAGLYLDAVVVTVVF